MRVIVSGAGTTGHISPALAVVDALEKRDKDLQVVFVGGGSRLERQQVEQANIRYKSVVGGKFRRTAGGYRSNLLDLKSLMQNVIDVFKIGIGTLQCLFLVSSFKPDVIFNKAGTVGLPVGLAARALGVPMVIHEPDLTPGWGNRILSRWASKVAVGFPVENYRAFPKAKMEFTGTPVRSEVVAHLGQAKKEAAKQLLGESEQKPITLVVGGSQGAHLINQLLWDALPDLGEVTVVHVPGERDIAQAKTEASRVKNYFVKAFLSPSDMGSAYAAADIVVARAGANTLAELAAFAKPAIIIPNSTAAAHQIKNARVLEKADAAIVEDERILSSGKFAAEIKDLINSKDKKAQLANAIRKFNQADAAEKLAEVIEGAADAAK
jgi:UDP-N-acetylglucosamine--N-acetylmuramyl-(pentapeptide) pyrophosphoryl-undecaprenol N-acetylglucosamine transferase